MSGTRSSGLVLRALIAALLVAIGSTPPAAGATTVALGPRDVVAASTPTSTAVPADGRLRGSDFSAVVTGVAWPGSVSVAGVNRMASTGDRLVVFTLRLSQRPQDVGPLAQATAASATLDVGSDQLPVDLRPIDEPIEGSSASVGTGTATYAASVPVQVHDVVLDVAEGGFAQRFDLWTLRRLPPSPVVLYRDQSSATVNDTTSASAQVPIENPADGYRNAADVTLSGAALTYFAPDGSGATPTNPADAYLVVDLSATYPNLAYGDAGWGHYFADLGPLPPARLTFTPTAGTAVTATSAPESSTTGNPVDDDGLFDALYWFTVPATTTAGTLTIGSGPLTGTEYTGFVGGSAVPLELTTDATLGLAFPSTTSTPSAQRIPPWVGAPLPPTQSVTPATTGAAARGGFPIWLAVALVGLFAVALLLGQRRWRRRRETVSHGEPTIDAPFGPAPAWSPGHGPGNGTPIPTGPLAPNGPPNVATWGPAPSGAPPIVPTAPPEVGPARPAPGNTAVDIPVPGFADPPVLGDPGDVVVRVLGPVEVSGWERPTERRASLEALCAFLALHTDRPLGSDELLAALWPLDGPRGEATRKTLRNTLSRLRQAVGTERLPDAPSAGGYRLVGVTTDWARFQELIAQAKQAPEGDADRLLAEALRHVRGVPFAGAPLAQYTWAFEGPYASDMTVAIVEVAHDLGTRRLGAGDVAGAVEAARAGLRASRAEFVLWADLVAAARAGGDPSALRRVLADGARVLGPDVARLDPEAAHLGPSRR